MGQKALEFAFFTVLTEPLLESAHTSEAVDTGSRSGRKRKTRHSTPGDCFFILLRTVATHWRADALKFMFRQVLSLGVSECVK